MYKETVSSTASIIRSFVLTCVSATVTNSAVSNIFFFAAFKNSPIMPSANDNITEQCYQVLVQLIENNTPIKEYICSNTFKGRLSSRAHNPTIISLPPIEYNLFIRYIDAVKPFLNARSTPSLTHYFKMIMRYLVEVNENFIKWVKTQIHFDGEDLSNGEVAGLVTVNLSGAWEEGKRLVAVTLKCFLYFYMLFC